MENIFKNVPEENFDICSNKTVEIYEIERENKRIKFFVLNNKGLSDEIYTEKELVNCIYKENYNPQKEDCGEENERMYNKLIHFLKNYKIN
jgi:serine/threonine protein phosphatase PrpC